ncbi:MAG: PaaI family thioesterase [Desulfobacca sp.]|nr:PaaI family thioesterase [Desulfobacca sp.]
MKKINPEYLQAILPTVNECPFFQLISMSIVEIGEGTSFLEIALSHKHLQPFQMVHGGVFSSLVDAAVFWAVYSLLKDGQGLTTVEMKCNYLAPARTGKMVARGTCIKLGKTLALGQTDVIDDQGRLLAHGTATMMVLPDLVMTGSADLPPKFILKE